LETRTDPRGGVNNAIYDELRERWYEADDDPVALLRAESRLRNPWVAAEIARAFGPAPTRVLDVGCGAGFLANYLASSGHRVTGLDAAPDSLDIAAQHDPTRTVRYEQGDANALPYKAGAFDVACAMDFLEHVEGPARVIGEIGRVLAPGGLFFFHTFNRNWLAWLVVIKGVEWFVRNTPRDLHVLRLFLKPAEVAAMCAAHGMDTVQVHGSRPEIGAALARMLMTGTVPGDFRFTFTRSTKIAFTGFARKKGNTRRDQL
jgi:2-polyprenyl-6-hydroxyphenyl methylase/3-demethylubiquinone-9 3-methyltransferase